MRSTAGRLPVGLALLLALVALVAGCGGVFGATISTDQALHDAGFGSAKVGLSPNGGSDGTIDASVSVAAAPTPAVVDRVDAIVWANFHERFSVLDVTVSGSGPTLHRSDTFADLQSRLGVRPASDDRTSLTGSTESLGLEIVGGVAAVAVVGGGVVLAIVVSRRRRARRGPGPGGPGGSGPPGQPAWAGPGAPRPPGPGWSPPSGSPWGEAPAPPPGSPPGPGGWGAPVPPGGPG